MAVMEIANEKFCKYCSTSKPRGEFYFHSCTKDKLANICKKCHISKAVERQKKNPEATNLRGRLWKKNNPEKYKNQHLRKRYGISLEVYKEILARQGGGCGICGNPQSKQGHYLGVDHCHITNKVRGLLCYSCNIGLGNFHDDIEKMEKAIAYLRKNK